MADWHKHWIVIGSLITTVGIVGCTSAENERFSESTAESTAEQIDLDSLISLQEAIAIAEATVEGKANAAEREMEDNQPVIDVEIGSNELLIDAESGEVLEIEDQLATGDPEDEEEVTEAMELQPLATIPIQEALNAAEQGSDERAHTVELENEDGNLVYEVVIGLDEIYVDAGNGEILFTEVIQGIDGQELRKSSIQVPFDEDNDD